MTTSWLQPHLAGLLSDRVTTLANWRQQEPALSGRPKNFENWLLVELVDHLWRSGEFVEVRTNGQFDGKKVKASDVAGLSGKKAQAKHLSTDLSARLKSTNRTVSAEIKTGLAPGVIVEDLLIVRHCNNAKVTDHGELAWVALLPVHEAAFRSATKTVEKAFSRLEREGPDFTFIRKDVQPWLIVVSAVPR